MIWSKGQLERRLADWHANGWVTADGRQAIAAELAASGGAARLPKVLAVLAATLLAFAAMSFVAANWSEMSRLARLVLLAAALIASYAAAVALHERRMHAFADAAVVLGASIFGASIMLVAQMYHIDGNPPDAVLVWAAGALGAGLVFAATPSIVLAMLLVALWAGMETGLHEAVFWWFLPAWGIVAAALLWRNSRGGLHLAALVLSAWIVSLGATLPGGRWFGLVTVIGLAGMATAAIAEAQLDSRRAIAASAFVYALAVAFAGVLGLQFVHQPTTAGFALIAALSLAGLAAAIWWSAARDNRAGLWVAYAAFALQILVLYSKTVGTLLNTSLFFLVAGLIACGLAWLAWQLGAKSSAAREVRA